MSGSVWIALGILISLIWMEMVMPKKVMEGFQWASTQANPKIYKTDPVNILTAVFEKRGDIGPSREEGGYKSDKRYFADYADVQAIGEKKDFCRAVFPEGGKEEDLFFACGLAGTAGLTSVDYRTKSKKDGFVTSRDDYMRAIGKDGRDSYCRILKIKGQYEPMCLQAGDFSFSDRNTLDTDPPENIKTLIDFYRGCQMWLRFRDDMLDYMDRTIIQTAGGLAIIEDPAPTVSKALNFNGINQFIRLGDSRDLTLGNLGSLRSVRAFSVWVRFDEFTNNAHIFDFGNGAGRDNVFLGILGKGDPDSNGNWVRNKSNCPETTVPEHGSGAQFCKEMRSEDLYRISAANVDDFECPGAEIYADPKKARPINTRPLPADPNAKRSAATLMYEVWDSSLRKMQVKINKGIGLNEWTHIVVTAASMDAMRPDIQFYVNGELLYTQEAGFLPQNQYTEKNYIGKSNWTDQPGEYELRDELFKGSVFDFRMYNRPLGQETIKKIIKWGAPYIGTLELNKTDSSGFVQGVPVRGKSAKWS
jgi:hypothetical protein